MHAEDGTRERLTEVTTEDGLILDGVVISPIGGAAVNPARERRVPIVWIHGWYRSFLAPTPLRVGHSLARLGHTFIGANTRGAGYGMPLRNASGWTSQLGGGIWELFSESPRAVAAWVGYAAGLAGGPVGLLGHSLGGLKVLHYLAREADHRVLGLCLASPPVRQHRPEREPVAQAKRMVAAGRGTEILLWEEGQPVLSAQAFLDRAQVDLDLFGFDTDTPAIRRIRCPLFAIFGESEPEASVALDRIRQGAIEAARVEGHLVAGADHAYTGQEDAVAALIGEWIESLSERTLNSEPEH
jgi:pimeloyl-ACP methyl ester carboxylesterase